MTYLAEVYWDREFQLQQQGFDFTYDKRLLDRLHHGDPREARGHLRADPAYSAQAGALPREPRRGAQRADVRPPHPRRRGARPSRCRACGSSSTASSKGAELRAPVQLGRWPDEPDRPDIRDFYARLLQTIDRPLFHDGEWSLLDVRGAGDTTHGDLIACAWRKGKDLAIVAANITDHAAQGLVHIGDLPKGETFELADQLSDQSYQWTRADLEERPLRAPGAPATRTCSRLPERWRRMQLRSTVLWLHRWAGIIFATFLFLVAITGCALVFERCDPPPPQSVHRVRHAWRGRASAARNPHRARFIGGLSRCARHQRPRRTRNGLRHGAGPVEPPHRVCQSLYGRTRPAHGHRQQGLARAIHLLHTRLMAGQAGEKARRLADGAHPCDVGHRPLPVVAAENPRHRPLPFRGAAPISICTASLGSGRGCSSSSSA